MRARRFGRLVLTEGQVDIKGMQISLDGFLGSDAPSFCLELYKLLLDAQTSKQGIPTQLVEATKEKLKKEKVRRVTPPLPCP
jgi:hypothetical protein